MLEERLRGLKTRRWLPCPGDPCVSHSLVTVLLAVVILTFDWDDLDMRIGAAIHACSSTLLLVAC